MSVEYKIIEGQNLVIVKVPGTVSDKEILDYLDDLAHDERYISPMKKLVDFSLTDQVEKTYDGAVDVAKRKTRHQQKFIGEICAFVAPADITYGMCRMHQALMEGSEGQIEVFRRLDQALKWLGVQLDKSFENWLAEK